jgi:hypothetical protein
MTEGISLRKLSSASGLYEIAGKGLGSTLQRTTKMMKRKNEKVKSQGGSQFRECETFWELIDYTLETSDYDDR